MKTLNYKNRTPALAELKVSYRRNHSKSPRPETRIVPNAEAAIAFFRGVWDNDTIDLREEFLLLCLTPACEVLGWTRLSTGNREATALDPRTVFGVALATASSAIVVAHNHPGGPCRPSQADLEVTRQLEKGADVLRILLLDHIILTRDEAFSFGQAGLLGI